MTSKRFLSGFLIATSLFALLTACDDSSSTMPPQPESKTGDISALFTTEMFKSPPSWTGSYLASRVAQNRFDWPRAETFLTQADQIRPNSLLMDRRLMLLAMGAGDFDAALKHAKALKPEEDPSGLTHLILLLEPLKDGQIITAQNLMQTLPKTSLGTYALPLLRAWTDAAQGKPDLSSLSKENSYFYHQILLADFLGQIDTVVDPVRLKGAQNQFSAIASERTADIFLRNKKYDLAADLYALTRTLNSHAPSLDKKEEAAKNKSPDVANLSLYPPVANASAGIALTFFDMATTFYNDQGFESAQLFARMSLVLDPNLTEAHLLLGNILSRNGRIDSAIEIYQAIPKTEPRYKAVQQQIAALQVGMEQDAAAIATLQNLLVTINDRPEKVSILLQIGDIHRENEAYELALNSYNEASRVLDNKIEAPHWDLLYARGMTLERLKRWDDAEKDLRAALTYQPNHPYLMNYLGYSWADQGFHLDQAMELLLKAVQIVPDDGYVTDSVGWVYYRMKKYDKAVTYMERAVELLPYDPTVNDHLGDVYWSVGRKREARFQWQRAFNYSKDDKEKFEIQKKLDNGLTTATP